LLVFPPFPAFVGVVTNKTALIYATPINRVDLCYPIIPVLAGDNTNKGEKEQSLMRFPPRGGEGWGLGRLAFFLPLLVLSPTKPC
jgi:hypothetical protein